MDVINDARVAHSSASHNYHHSFSSHYSHPSSSTPPPVYSRAASALSGSASLLSGSLSKIFKSFLTHPNSCLLESEKPKSLKIFSGNSDAAKGTGVGVKKEEKKSRKQPGTGSVTAFACTSSVSAFANSVFALGCI